MREIYLPRSVFFIFFIKFRFIEQLVERVRCGVVLVIIIDIHEFGGFIIAVIDKTIDLDTVFLFIILCQKRYILAVIGGEYSNDITLEL